MNTTVSLYLVAVAFASASRLPIAAKVSETFFEVDVNFFQRTLKILLCLAIALSWRAGRCPSQEASRPVSDRLADPVTRNIEGWVVKVDPQLLAEEDSGELALKALANHLQRISWMLPPDKVSELRELPIWIEAENPRLTSMQYHPSKRWLLENEHDLRLAKHVHIPRAKDLLQRQTWAKHPYVILHELAHAYHDQVLGFEHRNIKQVYNSAKDSGIYESVLDHRGRRVEHYALKNEKEFFAEATEAYLGVNDFYPFVRAELQEFDPRTFALLQAIWGEID